MRWDGWGERPRGSSFPESGLRMLGAELGLSGRHTPSVALEDVGLAQSRLTDAARAALVDVVGARRLDDSREARTSASPSCRSAAAPASWAAWSRCTTASTR